MKKLVFACFLPATIVIAGSSCGEEQQAEKRNSADSTVAPALQKPDTSNAKVDTLTEPILDSTEIEETLRVLDSILMNKD
jgi:hypothetical protein